MLGGVLALLTWLPSLPSLFPHSSLLSSLFITTHSHPLKPMVGLGDCPVCSRKVVVKLREKETDAIMLIVWRSYGHFNSAYSCWPHSTFHRQCKIADILIYTLYIYSNTGIFLIWANISAGCCYWINHFEHSQMNLANNIADFIAPSTALLKSWII